MTAAALITRLRALDVRLSAAGGKLHVNAPKGTLTPELLDTLRSHKPELLATLAATPRQTTPQPATPRLSPPDHAAVDYVAAVGMLLIAAVQAGRIDEDQYWELCGQFDERAAIAEFDGGLTREQAERLAFDEIRQAITNRGMTPQE